eukprot:m.281832 g.281832  ORF g.281832 m.281832 type:complete len:107 (+) comp17744_c0_seq1:951-1271(+)
MIGEYLQALDDAGLTENTIIVLSSDHGDMQMQHEQFYKMVAYEASSHVPLVIAGPGVTYQGEVDAITSMVESIVWPTRIAAPECLAARWICSRPCWTWLPFRNLPS